jgi:hypothetical protein
MCLAISGGSLAIHRWSWQVAYDEFMWLAAAALTWVAYNGIAGVIHPTPDVVQSSVKRFILALILLDTCIAWSVGGPVAGLLTASLLIPTTIFGRAFRVT